MRSSRPFDGRIALVTGGGSGIGRATALGLARDGAQVAITGRTLSRLEETAQLSGGSVVPFVCDMAEAGQVRRSVSVITETLGEVDFLINAAGLYIRNAIAQFDMDDWHRVMEANLYGPALAIHHCLPGMLERDFGRIVTLGSRSAHSGGAVTSAYSASKAGVEGLTRSVADEILWKRTGRPNVQANVLYPGQTVTGLLGTVAKHPERHQSPEEVYPMIRALLIRPRWAAAGQIVYRHRIISRGGLRLQAKHWRANIRQVISR